MIQYFKLLAVLPLLLITHRSAASSLCELVLLNGTSIVTVDYTGRQPEQADFDAISWQSLIGQQVTVHFKSKDGTFKSRPLVNMVIRLDDDSKKAVAKIRQASNQEILKGHFKESAIWQIYTNQGVFQSAVHVGESYEVPNHISGSALDQLLKIVLNRPGILLEDVEWYHTHKYNGEPISSGDESYLSGVKKYLMRNIPPHNWAHPAHVSFYAVGPVGDIIFNSSRPLQ